MGKIKFGTDGNLPTGIGSTIHYYISVIDKDSFRVSEVMNVGTGDTLPKDFNYINRRYVDFVDGGTEIHNIQFLPIELKVEAPIGITTTSGQDFAVKVQPVFQGEITSVSVKKGGINYGSPDILNYVYDFIYGTINRKLFINKIKSIRIPSKFRKQLKYKSQNIFK